MTLHGTLIWLGRDTEADANIVFHETQSVLKIRTVKRQVPSVQWDRELRHKMTSTPWDPKCRNDVDTICVLPSNLDVTGRVPPSPGLSIVRDSGLKGHDGTGNLELVTGPDRTSDKTRFRARH